jgi:hypothetical protein
MSREPYYDRPEVSNSVLSELQQYFNPTFTWYDPEVAYRQGNLVDFTLTEPTRINYFKRTIDIYDQPFTEEEFEMAKQMKKSFMKNELAAKIYRLSEFQKIFTGQVDFTYGSFEFSLQMRCKYDMFSQILKWGSDIKSTASTSQKQFEDACVHFDYPRSRVLYMLLSKSERDLIIGISKKNYEVFTIPIVRGDKWWNEGLEKLTDLAFKYWVLFNDFKLTA